MVLSILIALFLRFLYGLSGVLGLSYEVLWVRLESLQFGLSVFAVVVTVAAFMTGLGSGAWLALRWIPRRPWRWLALLDASVALYSLVLPELVHQQEWVLMHWGALQGVQMWHLALILCSFLSLTLPAIPMGASLPLVLHGLPQALRNDKSLGQFYGVNTLGAVFGALLPLLLLPLVGWGSALRAVAVLGLLLALGWWWVDSRAPGLRDPGRHEAERWPGSRLLVGYAILGASSLSLEVAWTRLFGLLFLRTEYVLGMILASFLLGIGLGSLAGSRWPLEPVRRWLPWLTTGSILMGLAVFPWVAAWAEIPHGQSLLEALVLQGLVLLLMTLPVTFVLGLWFPLLGREATLLGGVSLYAANALGGAVGALLTGFLLIPWLGTSGTLVLSAWVMLLTSTAWSGKWRLGHLAGFIGMVLLGVSVWAFPSAARLLPQTLAGAKDMFRYEDAVAMTEVVEQSDGQRLLLTDLQRHDASTESTAAFVQKNQGRLPLLLQADPKRVLFLGLGTGLSLAGSAPYPQLERVAVELSQGAIEAAQRYFSVMDQGVLNESEVVRDDARHYLASTSANYDVIIGDLYHPDLAGVGALLSKEQFQRARMHLTSQGIFVQWLALNQFDDVSLQTVMRTFQAVFPDARIFLDGMHLALVGPKTTWGGFQAVRDGQARLSAAIREQATGGEGTWTWLGRYCGSVQPTPGPLQSEENPIIEFDLPALKYRHEALPGLLQTLLRERPSLETAMRELSVPQASAHDFEKSYLATGALVQSWLAAMAGRSGEAQRWVRLAFDNNPEDRWVVYAFIDEVLTQMEHAPLSSVERERVLTKLAARFPWHVDLLRALWHEELANQENAAAELTRQQLLRVSPLDREARSAKNAGLALQ